MTSTERSTKKIMTTAAFVVVGLALVKLALHLLTAQNYGLFIDELYFLASGEHLAWGFVDFPPLTAFVAWVVRALFHDSLLGIHLIPALEGAALVLLGGALVRELGGKIFAQAVTGLSIVIAPVYLVTDGYLSMNAAEPLIWMGCVWVLVRLVKTGESRWWIAFGSLAGLGLLNKHTMLLFGFAVLVGILLTPARKHLLSPWFFIGGALALVIFLPNLLWLIQNHFPHLEQLANIRANHRNLGIDPLSFLGQQVLFQHPLTLPLWLGGMVYFFFHPTGKTFRFLGWTFVLMLGILLVVQGRPYYLSSIYPMLLGAGAIWFEEALNGPKRWWGKPASLTLLAVGGAVLAPFSLPLLSPENYVRYARAIGFDQPRIENARLGALPQLFADRFGWPEMADSTAKVFRTLTPAEQAKAVIFTGNYGQAGTIDFYGPALGLPHAMSGHLAYFHWGQEAAKKVAPDAVFIVLGKRGADLTTTFQSVEVAGQVEHPYAMPYENFPIYLCRGLKTPLDQLWPSVKQWD